MKNIKKYPNLKGKYIIESFCGCYTESGWCYITNRESIIQALEFVNNMKYPYEYRIVNCYGEVLERRKL